MASDKQDFTRLERAVLATICELNPTHRGALEGQLSAATVRSRENTGAGFYTYVEIDRGSKTAVEGERLGTEPTASIGGLQHGMGFILWLNEGFAHCLEGYSFDESTTAVDLERASFEILPRQAPD